MVEANEDTAQESPEPQEDEDPESLPEWAKKKLEQLESNVKGQQRTNERLRRDLQNSITTEEIVEKTNLSIQGLERLYGSLSQSPLLDEESAEKLKAASEELAATREGIEKETAARKAIGDNLARSSLDLDDDSLSTAVELLGDGKFDEAVREVERVTKMKQEETLESRIEAAAEKKLRERGQLVDSSPSGGKPAAKSKLDEVEELINKGKKEYGSSRDALAAWVQAHNG